MVMGLSISEPRDRSSDPGNATCFPLASVTVPTDRPHGRHSQLSSKVGSGP